MTLSKLTDTQVSPLIDSSIPSSDSSSNIQNTFMIQSLQQNIQAQILPSQFSIHYQMPQKWDARQHYKPVNRKHQLVPATFPEDAHVTRRFPEDPLLSLKPLSTHLPNFIPSLKLTQERLNILKINCDGFLWPDEERLFIIVFNNNEDIHTYTESEQGTLRSNYFSDYIIPIVEHEPWAHTESHPESYSTWTYA